jgi:3-hydroxyacyl-[acyl-carrier-protein] dehydratase
MKLLDEMFSVESAKSQISNLKSQTSTLKSQTSTRELRLNASHPIYQAHFPNNPITPGVCIVQMIGELLQQQTGNRLELEKIHNIKFLHPISPLEYQHISVSFDLINADSQHVRTKGTITAKEQVVTKFSLTFVSC